MDIKITVKPTIEKVSRVFKNIPVTNAVSDAINRIAANVERFGKQLSPVDTGYLRASIHFSPASVSNLQSIVKTDTDYAIFVHEGTRFMRGRPFLEQGAKLGSENFAGIISDRLDEAFVRAFKTL